MNLKDIQNPEYPEPEEEVRNHTLDTLILASKNFHTFEYIR